MNNALEELKKEIELTYEAMDKVSDSIHRIESSLQDLKLHFPFYISLQSFDKDLDGSLAWEKFGDKYRICYLDQKATKPFSEMPFAVRHKTYQYLNRFVVELTKYLKQMREEIPIEDGLHHRANGCSYGQADGPDDYIKDCDCQE